ncbi:FAD dependent oxidoreductase [Penicillium bovifimosum]|uniref:FAD dependent oxidoreductase n=1 Tax=Penicillium bovifimosum TaxID=126998 RepID=A0A9W9GVX8_9EURO|nr:FAD dependent oxidoreductase [Penicillium bovifimosum]KAJ5131032.1 FAD dependent oxidoreductase [Penicillium bovifimosum]
MGISKRDPIIIVGGGAFGLSTALHLTRSGFTDISVFERDDHIPPRYSAANDLNKIVRAEYEDPFYTDLTIKAIAAWKTPLFAPHFHQTGFLHCVSGEAPQKAIDTLNRFRASADGNEQIKPHVVPLKDQNDIRQACWQLNGPLPGWTGYLNRFDGYAHSGNALAGVHRAAQAAGVRFYLGMHGAVDEIVYVSTLQGKKSSGIRTKDGKFHPSSLVIVAAGGAVGRLVPEIGKKVVAKSWSVAHVHLTDEETSALRGIPVTYARDLGFLFEPDPRTNLLKICPMGGGYVNTDPETGVSHAPATLEESAFVPEHDEAQMRKLLAHTLPALAGRPLVKKSLCWFADTDDSDFIIDYVPETSSSVVILSGDSGHGFKMFPIFGSWVFGLIQAGRQSEARWRWKYSNSDKEKENWGGDVSWRIGESKELSEIRPGVSAKL